MQRHNRKALENSSQSPSPSDDPTFTESFLISQVAELGWALDLQHSNWWFQSPSENLSSPQELYVGLLDLLDLCLLIPRGTQGRNNTPISHPILAGPPLIPPNSDCLQLFLHTPSQRLPWPSHFPLSLRVPAKCLSRYICCRLSKSMANPSPLSSLYFCNNLLMSRPFP